MKKTKYIIYAALLTVILCLICGCHSMYPIEIKTLHEDTKGKVIDILLPMGDNDEQYIDAGFYSRDALDMKEDDIIKTDIYKYDTDGYRSMLIHHPLEDYNHYKLDDSEYDISAICLNGYTDLKTLCVKYKKFKIAVLNYQGEVLSVSEEYDLLPKKNVYLESIEFDIVNNKADIKYKYRQPLILGLTMIAAGLISIMMPLSAAAALLFTLLLKFTHRIEFPKSYHVLIFMLFNIPSIVFIATCIDDAYKNDKPPISTALNEYWELFNNFFSTNAFAAIYMSIPIVIVAALLIWAIIERNKDKR